MPGFITNKQTREDIFNHLLSFVNEYPIRISSALLQEELRNLEQKNNGRIEASQNNHDDSVIAFGFCLYVRYQLIKEGLVEEEGKVPMKDPKKINYFLDVAMSTSEPKIIKNTEGTEFQIIDKTEKETRKRILQGMGYPEDYEAASIVDNYVLSF